MVKKKTKRKGGKKFKPIKLDGNVRFVREHYHAECPNGQVIPCVVGWLGDQLQIKPEEWTGGPILDGTDYDDNRYIRKRLTKRFKIDDEGIEYLQMLNDDGNASELRNALIDAGIVDYESKFTIELVDPLPDEETGLRYKSLDSGMSNGL